MKHLLTLLLVVATATAATAQKKLTEKDLLGKWTITSIGMYMGTIDFKKQKFIPSEELKADMTEEDLEMAETALLESMAGVAEYYMAFESGYKLESNIDNVGNSTYKIIEKDGKQYLTDAEVQDDDLVEIFIKNKQLHFLVPDDENGGNIVLLFEK
ncbi:hypothetical protein AM493_18465 [Flavobacterium akiainvivens]|uniref:Lipocalin-like domain-containing protein n=1 Tax=Flavobacterium akiainvivens TaxID=1202724 RepID=A0A0M8MDB9_9FLAO|nr:hypothetical protein [Flavobacterium akiainvivens]KOS07815.1 hypothetical protein AM493_18465 [Flavobacterium akiainvivens]SFQ26911.1 hypothetical protein SAMN05444144_102275 [Flavobacterium akiainvivens]